MNDKYYMEMALSLAKATLGQTTPNPCVGAVLVKDNQIIGQGAHLKSGSDHAEIIALKQALNNACGATLYVTLEPCCHIGKTGPCVDMIIKHGVDRVVIAVLDPNQQVSGLGVKKLQEAGLRVEVGLCEAESTDLNQIFFHYITTNTPYVTLKCGMSLDAKLATKTMESKWITGEIARNDAHWYRHTHDAILIGVNTVIADDPALTTRLSGGGRNPIRIILDTHLRTPITAKVITDNGSKTWLVTSKNSDKKLIKNYEKHPHVSVIQMPTDLIDLNVLMKILGERQVSSILVEGGRRVISAFCDANLFQQLILYVAPKLIGGIDAPNFFMGFGYDKLNTVPNLCFKTVELIGDDLKLVLTRKKE